MTKRYTFNIRVFNEDGTYEDTQVVVRAENELEADMKVDVEADRITCVSGCGYDFWMIKK